MALLPLEDAVARIISKLTPLETTSLPLHQVVSRVLANDIKATRLLPPFHNSAMDGYAVLSSATESASSEVPVLLKLQGVAAAGHPFEEPLKPEHAVRIFTGAPVPEQADAIVIQEK